MMEQKSQHINLCVIGDQVALNIFSDITNLLLYSFQAMGYQAQISNNHVIADQKWKNIIVGGHLLADEQLERLPSDSIFLNTEQLVGLSTSTETHYAEWYKRIMFAAQRFEMWDYSVRNIEHLNQHQKVAKYLKLGFQKEMKRVINRNHKDIDVLFYGSLNQRRKVILAELQKLGLNVVSLFNVFGEERDSYIARAKIVLNLHYFDAEIFEIVRCFYLMTNEVAIVSEVNPNTHIDNDYRNGICGVPYDQLVQTCVDLLQNEARLDQLRFDSLKTIMQLPQERIMQDML